MIKPQEHNSARELFFQTNHTQAEIARQVGVEAKTVNLWVKNGRWKEIKEAARRTPSILVEQYFTQLAELNNAIASRGEGNRFPTLREAETMRKLIVCINNIQKQTSLGASIDVVQNFIGRVNAQDNDLAQKVIPYANDFLQGKELNGHKSFELAYDIPDHDTNSSFEGGQGDIEARHEQSQIENPESDHSQSIVNDRSLNSEENMSPSPLEKDGMRQSQPDHSQSIPVPAQTGVNDESLNQQVIYPPKCIRDPDDPYTFYYDKITRRTADSPKYGKPPEGFREVPKKDCLDKDYYGKGFGRYNWL